MAQLKPEELRPETDDEFFERLRSDPRVTVHYGSGKPYASRLTVAPGLDVLELLGRRGNDEDGDEDHGE
jgi:hypothetical protein